MASTVTVNDMTAVHKSSDGKTFFAPDVCLTPTSGGPVPIPYTNIASSADTANGSTSVKIDGSPVMLQDSVFSTSTGDEAGSCGGVGSGVIKGKAQFINYSFDVKIEGKCVPRLGDQMIGNMSGSANTPPMAEMQPPLVVPKDSYVGEQDKLTVQLLDGRDEPMKNKKCILKKPDGTREEMTTDGDGKIHVPKTIYGVGKVVFPDTEGIISYVE